MQVVEKEFQKLVGFRAGASYHGMDLHTHSPASECSSFSLPGSIEKLVPKKPKSGVVEWRQFYTNFRADLKAGQDPFAVPFADDSVSSRPSLGDKMLPRRDDVADIVELWFREIDRGEDEDRCLTRLVGDLRRYLASFLFPEEFVLRCLIEGLHLVALTDHNHPGFIVPRLPRLGTWYSALEQVNSRYSTDINEKGGKTVSKNIVARLELARARLAGDLPYDEVAIASRETRDNHQEQEKEITNRLAHVQERLAYWKSASAEPHFLTLLPGTEITVSNIHLLSIYPPAWYVPGRIAGVLRAIGIPEEHWGRGFDAAASSSVQDAISAVHELGGIAIPAHANSDFKGVLRLFKEGLALRRVLEHPALLAVESTGGTVLADREDACESLRWLHTGRSKPKRTKALSLVKGSDAHECRIELDGTGEDLGRRYSKVKLDIRANDTVDEVFHALRLALMSGQSRIIEWPVEDGYNYVAGKQSGQDYRIPKEDRLKLLSCERQRPTILGLQVSGSGSYANGLKIRFNPFLNCIVGSGGKSTVVRLLSYVFGALGFMEDTEPDWLPATVRAYWRHGDEFNCIRRKGRHKDPNHPSVAVRWWQRKDDGSWSIKVDSPAGQEVEGELADLSELVQIWPPAPVQQDPNLLSSYEEEVIDELIAALAPKQCEPLLVNQPRDIFNTERLFEKVLAQPLLKTRQIIWSTASANVPTALDAEKVIVTGEKKGGRQMKVLVAGDFHEDEIREAFLDNFEGGWLGFSRRANLYNS